jgi:type VI secretion system protein VasJ
MMGKSDASTPVPKAVSELLAPVPGNSPSGDDASSSEPYFRLEMEIGKVNPDYGLCASLASEILKDRSKDLRVAAWLCFVLFRNEKVPGFIQGFVLVRELIKTFGNRLFPVSPVHRGKSLQFLNSSRVVKLLEAEKIGAGTAQGFIDLLGAFQDLQAETNRQLSEHAPELGNLAQVISARAEEAKEILKGPPSPPKGQAPSPPERPAEPAPGRESGAPPQERAPEKRPEPVPERARDEPESGPGLRDLASASDKDAIVAIKRALRYFLEQEGDDARRYASFVFGISRALVWGKLVTPAGEDGVTALNAPDGAIQSKIKEWFSQKEWDKLITAVESNFLDEDSGFKYWITAQRYLCEALEHKGGGAAGSSEEIRFHIARLLQRFPDFQRLKFSNKTPFLDEDTARWIDETVRPLQGGGGGGGALLPPILGEDYEAVNREYQTFCAELPKNFEANLKAMELGIAADSRPKGKFLRSLNLANYCQAAKQMDLAKVHIGRLLEQIESRRLFEWEPALCAAAWESAYLINKKLIAGEKNRDRQEALEMQQKELFERLVNYDGVLALRLAHLK